MTNEIFYRYEDVQYAPSLDEYDEPIRGSGLLRVHLREYKVLKHTPCGVQLDIGRFVNTQRHKQFAHATKEAAKESFIAQRASGVDPPSTREPGRESDPHHPREGI